MESPNDCIYIILDINLEKPLIEAATNIIQSIFKTLVFSTSSSFCYFCLTSVPIEQSVEFEQVTFKALINILQQIQAIKHIDVTDNLRNNNENNNDSLDIENEQKQMRISKEENKITTTNTIPSSSSSSKLCLLSQLSRCYRNIVSFIGRRNLNPRVFLFIQDQISFTTSQSKIINEISSFGLKHRIQLNIITQSEDLSPFRLSFELSFKDTCMFFSFSEAEIASNLSKTKRITLKSKYSGKFHISKDLSAEIIIYTKTNERKPLPIQECTSQLEDIQKRVCFFHKDTLLFNDASEVKSTVKSFQYGNQTVPMSAAFLGQTIYYSFKELVLLGTIKKRQLSRSCLMGGCDIVLPKETNNKNKLSSRKLINSLILATEQQNQLLLARFVFRQNAPPQLVTLYPGSIKGQLCFYLLNLPTSESIRHFPYGSLKESTLQQREQFAKLIDENEISKEDFKIGKQINPRIKAVNDLIFKRAIIDEGDDDKQYEGSQIYGISNGRQDSEAYVLEESKNHAEDLETTQCTDNNQTKDAKINFENLNCNTNDYPRVLWSEVLKLPSNESQMSNSGSFIRDNNDQTNDLKFVQYNETDTICLRLLDQIQQTLLKHGIALQQLIPSSEQQQSSVFSRFSGIEQNIEMFCYHQLKTALKGYTYPLIVSILSQFRQVCMLSQQEQFKPKIFNDLLAKLISPPLPTSTTLITECPIQLWKAIYAEGLTVISSSSGTEIDRSSLQFLDSLSQQIEEFEKNQKALAEEDMKRQQSKGQDKDEQHNKLLECESQGMDGVGMEKENVSARTIDAIRNCKLNQRGQKSIQRGFWRGIDEVTSSKLPNEVKENQQEQQKQIEIQEDNDKEEVKSVDSYESSSSLSSSSSSSCSSLSDTSRDGQVDQELSVNDSQVSFDFPKNNNNLHLTAFSPFVLCSNQEQFNSSLQSISLEYRPPQLSDSIKTNQSCNISNPYEYFKALWTEDIWQLIVNSSNRYGEQHNLITNKKYATKSDIQRLIVCEIIMGIKRLPSITDYFTSHPLLAGGLNCILTRNSYNYLNSILHISGNYINSSHESIRNSRNQDSLDKIEQFQSILSRNYIDAYIPSNYLAIDEGIIPFKGKTNLKVYCPDKPTKFGIKEYLLCDYSGYTLASQIYSPNRTNMNSNTAASLSGSKLQTQAVVNSLINTQKDRILSGTILVMDNFYNSLELLDDLTQKGIGMLGTVRLERMKNLTDTQKKDIKLDAMKKGATISLLAGSAHLLIWRDKKKIVKMLTNFLDDRQVIRKMKKTAQIKAIPLMIEIYNKYAHSVDKRNQICQSYRILRRCHKWWRCVFYRLLDTTLCNAYILYKVAWEENSKIGGKNEEDKKIKNSKSWKQRVLTHKEFRLSVVEGLIEAINGGKISQESKSEDTSSISQLLTQKQEQKKFIQLSRQLPALPNTPNAPFIQHFLKLSGKSGRCLLCKSRTNYCCETCSFGDKFASLCPSQCHKIHIQDIYSINKINFNYSSSQASER